MRLKEIRCIDQLVDYQILDEQTEVGILLLTIHPDQVFIRQIRINTEYRRKGYARKTIEKLLETYPTVSYCISTHSDSAIKFWKRMEKDLKDQGYFVDHIKGELYHIKIPTTNRS